MISCGGEPLDCICVRVSKHEYCWDEMVVLASFMSVRISPAFPGLLSE